MTTTMSADSEVRGDVRKFGTLLIAGGVLGAIAGILAIVYPEITLLALVIGDARTRHGLERTDVPRPRPPRTLGNTSLLPPIPGQKDDYPVRFTQLVCAENQRVGSVDGHGSAEF